MGTLLTSKINLCLLVLSFQGALRGCSIGKAAERGHSELAGQIDRKIHLEKLPRTMF